jgi:hypothetical protein
MPSDKFIRVPRQAPMPASFHSGEEDEPLISLIGLIFNKVDRADHTPMK